MQDGTIGHIQRQERSKPLIKIASLQKHFFRLIESVINILTKHFFSLTKSVILLIFWMVIKIERIISRRHRIQNLPLTERQKQEKIFGRPNSLLSYRSQSCFISFSILSTCLSMFRARFKFKF